MASPENIIRTKSHGTFEIKPEIAWGSRLEPCADPEGLDLDPKKVAEYFELVEDFPRIPAPDWQRVISLYYAMMSSGQKDGPKLGEDDEVSVLLARDAETLTRWRIFVPKQEVGGASVREKFSHLVDIETGEEFTDGLPPGWLAAGSSHSHNSMAAFFSGTDDRFELDCPGAHIVIGGLDKPRFYQHKASVVLSRRRFILPLESLVDVEADKAYNFHPNVMKMITRRPATNSIIFSSGESKEGFGRYIIPAEDREEWLAFFRDGGWNRDSWARGDTKSLPNISDRQKDRIRHRLRGLLRDANRWGLDFRMEVREMTNDLLVQAAREAFSSDPDDGDF